MTEEAKRPRVLFVGAGDRPHVLEEAERLRSIVEANADIVLTSFDFQADLSAVEADYAIVMGGDGSILRAARQMGDRQIPVLGVNLGKLGFLAALSPENVADVLPVIAAGQHRIVEHLMFHCSVIRAGTTIATQLGLNESAVMNGPPFSMLEVDLYVNDELATTYSCDGLIISTPVGSTAHSLSAGGPILRKNMQAFVVSPISPHTLTVRPVVDAADHVYEMVVRQPTGSTSVVVDGRLLVSLEPEDRVRVARAASCFKMIEVGGQSYYRTLRDKLGWGGNLTQRRPVV